MRCPTRADGVALLLLIGLWALIFGRTLWLPASDALVPADGDFYGQFLTFSTYQYDRLHTGEIPLWNPYNNGGFPFIADTQAAVFYPLRLLAMAIASLTGGWGVRPLLLEGLAHFLIASAGWYAFLRVLTAASRVSVYAAFSGTLAAVYGGFLMGYPLLQLAILEAAVWLPLVLVGILLATTAGRVRWHWLLVSGVALGISWLAGHPQTSWFCTVLAVVWLGYRAWQVGWRWPLALRSLILLGVVTGGITAITLLPGLEYLRYTTRADLGFAAKANGFPLRDVVQFLVPGVVSQFSPLFIGVTAFLLALSSLRRRAAWIWGAIALAALLLSFGGNAPFYGWVYGLPTGLSFFRGQERFAFVVSAALAVMTAYGVTLLDEPGPRRYSGRWLRAWALALVTMYALLTILSPADPTTLQPIVSATLTGTLGLVIVVVALRLRRPQVYLSVVCSVIAIELIAAAFTSQAVLVPPAAVEDMLLAAPLIAQVQQDQGIFRVDGFRGLRANTASMVGVQDIRGISPLFLTSANALINADYSHNPLAWELFAVKYVFSDRQQFSTPTQILAEGADRDGAIALHQLLNPRPFAQLLYQVDIVDSDEFAWALLHDPRYQPRDSVILLGAPAQPLSAAPTGSGQAEVTHFAPESVIVQISTPQNAVLSLAMVDYPGWRAALDGSPTPLRRAYGALLAVEIPAGDHTLTLTYQPLSFMIGLFISALTWAGCIGFALWSWHKGNV